jgi:AcrR family transcriptional regulator
MVRMSAEERRAQARLTARHLLAAGTTVDRLTLRMIAEEDGTPLPTLNYAYTSIVELLTDLRSEFESQVAQTQIEVGNRGLVAELLGMIESYVDILSEDPSNIEILRWQFLLIGRGEILMAGGMSMLGCLRRINQRSGEQWHVPIEDLSVLTQSMISGMHVQFFVQGADQLALKAWRRDARVIVNALGQLALGKSVTIGARY